MNSSEYQSPVDLEFIEHCFRQFPRARKALDALLRLGNPPAITLAEISSPSPKVEIAIRVLGALSRSKELAIVRASWGSLIGPWVRILLQDIILGDHEGPMTAEGIATWDRILMSVPGCFQSAFGESRESAHSLCSTTPYLEPLFTQTWLKVIDECHRTWPVWCGMLRILSESVDHSDGDNGNTGTQEANLPRNVVYSQDERTGKLLVRHINFHVPKIPRISDPELHNVTDFMLLLHGSYAGSAVNRLGVVNPLGLPAVVGQTIPALIKFAFTVMFKRKIDPQCPTNRIPTDVYSLVVLTLDCLYSILRDPISAVVALDSGVLKVILRAYPCFFRYDETGKRRARGALKLVLWTTSILERIARLVVYPNFLHAFLRAARNVEVEGLIDELKAKSPPTWKCWKELKDKAALLREIRNSMWEAGFITCANVDGYSLHKQLREMSPQQQVQRRRRQCSGCSWIMYCSVECQKGSWNDHKKLCPGGKTNVRANPSWIISPSDSDFFKALVENFVGLYTEAIQKAVDHYKLWLSDLESEPLPRDQQLIKDGLKNPMVYLIFDTPYMPTPDKSLEIHDPVTLASRPKPPIKPLWLMGSTEFWRFPAVNGGTILAVGAFPTHDKDIQLVPCLFRCGVPGEKYVRYTSYQDEGVSFSG
ncbi:hypothetical protein AAF712_012226 [Marasmius tenuissimus]|uniref:MYND-type domain-containing protein n=1 Tax=Marasmius tenuissimus TaxID=585030 RepID=A0ABR2ZH32_9AGAR